MNVSDKEIEFPYAATNQEGKTIYGFVTARNKKEAARDVKKYGYKRVRIDGLDSLPYRIWNFFPGWKNKLALAYVLLCLLVVLTVLITVKGFATVIGGLFFLIAAILFCISLLILLDL